MQFTEEVSVVFSTYGFPFGKVIYYQNFFWNPRKLMPFPCRLISQSMLSLEVDSFVPSTAWTAVLSLGIITSPGFVSGY